MLPSSYESVPEQLVSVPEQLVSLPEQLLVFRSSYKSSGTVISLPDQLVSAPGQFGHADFLHTVTPIRFHTTKTLGHLRSINPNTINHFANQSHTWQLLKIFFNTEKKYEKGYNLGLN